ncbi:unnamed protein product, partial [marine sediment metagenome]
MEQATPADKVFMLDIAYGAAKTIISRARFMSGAVAVLQAIQQ